MKSCLWCEKKFDKNSTFTMGNKTYYDKFCCNRCRSEYCKEYREPTYEEASNPLMVYVYIAIFLIIAWIYG
jgi:hypothetical protein